MGKLSIKLLLILILISIIIFIITSCGNETLSGTYTCVDKSVNITKLKFSGKNVIVVDYGIEINGTYKIIDGIIEINGIIPVLDTTIDIDYEYKIEIEKDSIFLDGIEYRKYNKKN